MLKPIIHDGTIQREMSNEEYESFLELNAAITANDQKKSAAIESKTALLDRLGITADEAKLLIS